MDRGYEYIMSNGGIDLESDYGFNEADGQCDVRKEKHHAVTISSYRNVPHNNEHQLMMAVNKGPVSVAIEADHKDFQFYYHGIFDSVNCGTKLNHAVLIVGYTSEYWIVKNSWG